MRSIVHRVPASVVLVLLAVSGVLFPRPALAFLDFWQAVNYVASIGALTCHNEMTPEAEAEAVARAWDNYRNKLAHPAIGQATIDGIALTKIAAPGSTVSLGFRWVDPSTNLEVGGPAVDHVEYRVNLDHTEPLAFAPIGTSYASGSQFALPYVITGCEPHILAIPYDSGNNEIVVGSPGIDNNAHAFALVLRPNPLPGTGGIGLALLVAALAGAGALAGCRRRIA